MLRNILAKVVLRGAGRRSRIRCRNVSVLHPTRKRETPAFSYLKQYFGQTQVWNRFAKQGEAAAITPNQLAQCKLKIHALTDKELYIALGESNGFTLWGGRVFPTYYLGSSRIYNEIQLLHNIKGIGYACLWNVRTPRFSKNKYQPSGLDAAQLNASRH